MTSSQWGDTIYESAEIEKQRHGPYLWISEVYVFPSAYETFSLAVHEAAAAGLPVIVTRGLHGVSELINDANGWLVARTCESVSDAMKKALSAGEHLQVMAGNAVESVHNRDCTSFVTRWRSLYARLGNVEGHGRHSVS